LKRRNLLSLLLLFSAIVTKGQETDKTHYIKIDGLTLDEGNVVLPQTGIYSFKLQRGAASDSHGVFSIISMPGDTVLFTLPGCIPTLLIIPRELSLTNYTADVHIAKDTITIEEVIVLPWKTYNDFKKAATQTKTISPEIENMNFNIALVKQQLYYNLSATPGEGYRFTVQQMANEFYTKGQLH
jgi:hypothetical protein